MGDPCELLPWLEQILFFLLPASHKRCLLEETKKEVGKKKYTARRLRPRDLRVKHKQQTVKHVCCESVRVMKSLAALAARKSHSAHADVLALHVLPRRHRASFIFTCRHASRCPHLHTVQTLASLTSSCSSPGSCESCYQTSKTNSLDCVGLFFLFFVIWRRHPFNQLKLKWRSCVPNFIHFVHLWGKKPQGYWIEVVCFFVCLFFWRLQRLFPLNKKVPVFRIVLKTYLLA